MEQLLEITIEAAVAMKAVKKTEFEQFKRLKTVLERQRTILAQAARAAKALFFVLAWIAAFLQMLRGGLQAGIRRVLGSESQAAWWPRVGGRPSHGLAASALR